MDNKEVIYRNGQFFVVSGNLSDNSEVHDVCANSAAGDEIITLQHAESDTDALRKCDALAEVLAQTFHRKGASIR